jgi:hypothetical protein
MPELPDVEIFRKAAEVPACGILIDFFYLSVRMKDLAGGPTNRNELV